MRQNAKRDDDRPLAQRRGIDHERHLRLLGPARKQHRQEQAPQPLRINGLVGEKAADGALLAAGLGAADAPQHLSHLRTGHALGQHDADHQPAQRLAAMSMQSGHHLLDNPGELLPYCIDGCLHLWSPFTSESFLFRIMLSLWTEVCFSASNPALFLLPRSSSHAVPTAFAHLLARFSAGAPSQAPSHALPNVSGREGYALPRLY